MMPRLGEYWFSQPEPTSLRCRAYTLPPGLGGEKVATLEPGTVFGPIVRVVITHGFVSVMTQGIWINVYKDTLRLAFRTNYATVLWWKTLGWQDRLHNPWSRSGWISYGEHWRAELLGTFGVRMIGNTSSGLPYWHPIACQDCHSVLPDDLLPEDMKWYSYRICPSCWAVFSEQVWSKLVELVGSYPADAIWAFLL